MANNFAGGFPVNSGTVPIKATGYSVGNARVDKDEFSTRPGYTNNSKIAFLYSRDLVFGRSDCAPYAGMDKDFQDSHLMLFGSFNGITQQNEDEFWFAGYAANSPEHQDRNGAVGQQFAVHFDGACSITCRSQIPIKRFARFYWRIPRSVNVPADPTQAGRLLAELVEYKPTDCVVSVHNIHAILSDLAGFKTSRAQANSFASEDKKAAQFAAKFGELLNSIAFTSILAFMSIDPTDGKMKHVPDREKLRIAAICGLTNVSGVNNQTVTGQKKMAATFQPLLLNTLFQMQYDPVHKVSSRRDGLLAFPLHPAGTLVNDNREQEVAARQANQIESMIKLLILAYDEEQTRIVGTSLSGGIPGFEMDVLIRRQ